MINCRPPPPFLFLPCVRFLKIIGSTLVQFMFGLGCESRGERRGEGHVCGQQSVTDRRRVWHQRSRKQPVIGRQSEEARGQSVGVRGQGGGVRLFWQRRRAFRCQPSPQQDIMQSESSVYVSQGWPCNVSCHNIYRRDVPVCVLFV